MNWKANNYPEEIAEALLHAVGHDANIEDGEGSPEYADITAEKEDVVEALYHLKAVCENPYNKDYFRTFYNILDELRDVLERVR